MLLTERVGPREEYQPVEVRVFAGDATGTTYPVELSVTGWRDFPPVPLRLDQAALTAAAADPAAYGRALGAALFAETALGPAFRETLVACQASGAALRVSLRLDPPELHALRWERLQAPFDGDWQPLGTTAQTPFARAVPVRDWQRPPLVVERPLRLLAVIASPTGLDAFNLDPITAPERQALHALLDGLPEVSVTYLETGTAQPASLEALRATLAGGYHLVHVLCHGARTPGGTVLYLERAAGGVDPVTTDRLVDCFQELASRPLCCFLAACESGAQGRADAFVPLGPTLVAEGSLQAVVAMTDRVGVETAARFSQQFYTRLLAHGRLDLAVNEARALVQESWDWSVPVLFSRLADNQLFDFPVGRIQTHYLAHADRAFGAAGAALEAARRQDHADTLVHGLEELIRELSKSHKGLVDLATNFRRVGGDPATFQANFEAFYYDFKALYDGATWVDEQTSCNKISLLRGQILPHLQPLLDAATFADLRQELALLGDADTTLLRFFSEYLDDMNQAVEAIWERVGARDLPEAIRLKRDFEARISASFSHSREMFGRMTDSLGQVTAA